MGYDRAMTFRSEIPVRFGDCDYAKIVYYPKFLHFCHVAMEQIFADVVEVPYHEVVMKEHVAYPTVKADAVYIHQVGFGETLDIRVVVEKIGPHSVDWCFEGTRKSDAKLAFRIHSRTVAVDVDEWHAVWVPEHHRKGLEKLIEK